MFNLPNEIQSKITAELKRGEVVIWTGQPIPEKLVKKSLALGFGLWLFFIPWTAFSLYWMASATDFKLPDFSNLLSNAFALFGLPFVLIGVAGLSSPFWMPFYAKKKALSTVYVITNLRAFSIEGIRSANYKSYYPEQLKSLDRRQAADGTGDIILLTETITDDEGHKGSRESGFICIADVQKVALLLEKLADSALNSR